MTPLDVTSRGRRLVLPATPMILMLSSKDNGHIVYLLRPIHETLLDLDEDSAST